MRKVLENTDRYVLEANSDGHTAGMTRKRDMAEFTLPTNEAKKLLADWIDLLAMQNMEGSVYYEMTTDQMLAQLFSKYEHHVKETCH